MSDFNVNAQPNPSGVGKPTSGTYGEGAALDRLKKALPLPDGSMPAQQPTPPMTGAPPPTPSAPGSVPPAMFAPTRRPDVPVGTPLQQPPVNPVQTAATSRQRNLAILDAVINDPNVSTVTKEWAENLMAHLIQGSRR